jgi:Protein of unknown function (DUF3987)
MAAWSARLHGTVLRIAGILHLAGGGDPAALSIGPAVVDAAIAIGEWAIEHAFAAFGVERLDAVGRDAMRIRRWYRLRADPIAPFTLRDATRALKGLTGDQVRAAVERLEEHGYVRSVRLRPGPQGGRPSELVHIHPAEAAAA